MTASTTGMCYLPESKGKANALSNIGYSVSEVVMPKPDNPPHGRTHRSAGTLSAPFYAERYGIQHFASIKSVASFAMIILTASWPLVLGWLINWGLSRNELAAGAAVYAFVTTALLLRRRWH